MIKKSYSYFIGLLACFLSLDPEISLNAQGFNITDVGEPNPAYEDAGRGEANPRGGADGHIDSQRHNAGETEDSARTSWTPDKDTARDFATMNSGEGRILKKEFNKNDMITDSPDTQEEREILIEGPVRDAEVEDVQ